MNFSLFALITPSIWFHAHKQYTYGFHKSSLDSENSDLPCKEESAAIVHFFFDYVNTNSEQLGPTDPNAKRIIFRATLNPECFARWLSNPYAHCLAFISSIQISRGPCCLCLPMSIFLNNFLLYFLGRQLFLVTVKFLLILLINIFDCRWSGSRIVKDSGLCLITSLGSGISYCWFTVSDQML